MDRKTVILFSGGRESIINLHKEIALGTPSSDITLYYLDYGQKAYTAEIDTVKYFAKKYGTDIAMDSLPLKIPESIAKGVSSNNTVQGRNGVFVFMALNKFYNPEERLKILVGCVKSNYYNDGSSYFLSDINNIIKNTSPMARVKSHTKGMNGRDTLNYVVNYCDTSKLWVCDNDRLVDGKMCGECFKCVQSVKDWNKKISSSRSFNKIKDLWRSDSRVLKMR